MKKLALIILAVLMAASLVACSEEKADLTAINDYTEPDYTQNLADNTGTFTFAPTIGELAEITNFVDRYYQPRTITVPELVGEKGSERTVAKIGKDAFLYCTSLTGIVLPDTVTYIGDFAFAGCTALESITIPAGVTHIGKGAFSGCTSLKEIKFEGTELETIDAYAFNDCKALETITIPEGVVRIGDFTFNDCVALKSFTAPSTILYFGEMAFNGCVALNEKDAIDLSKAVNVKSADDIGKFTFADINKNNIKVPEDAETVIAKYVSTMKDSKKTKSGN